MLKTILLPLDGSSLAERALTYAGVLARRCEASVVLIEAVQPHTVPGVDPSDAHVEVTSRAEKYLTTAAGRLGADGIATETHVYYDDPVHAILDPASRHQADVIVVSTHGPGGPRRSVFGSVADRLVCRAPVPLFLVPSRCEVSWDVRCPSQILVPLDGSPLAEQALHHATGLARLLDAEILLVRALPPTLHACHRDDGLVVSCADFLEIEDAWRHLARLADRLRSHGCRASVRVLVGSPPVAIADAALAEGIDLIVITTHGRGGLSRLLLGSVADGVLQRTSVPILLIRSDPVPRSTVSPSAPTGVEPSRKVDSLTGSLSR